MIAVVPEMLPAAPGCSGCAARDEEIALLREQAEAQRARISELEEKVARLERLLSRNSGKLIDAPVGR